MSSRTDYAIKNSIYSSIIAVLNMGLLFFIRTMIIKLLGSEILGLNSLFTDILTTMSLVELGIGPAIVYLLFSPLSRKDSQEIHSLMLFFKKIYFFIGILISVIGLLFLPFLSFVVNTDLKTQEVIIIYLFFLLNSVLSYFFAYNRSLLFADQKGYKVAFIDFIIKLIGSILQIIGLLVFKKYYFFLFIQIIITIVSNILITNIVNKEYIEVFKSKRTSISIETKRTMKKFVIGKISEKIGGAVFMSTDSIFISIFLATNLVGIYDNYRMILFSATMCINMFAGSIGASIGNLAVSGDNKKFMEVFKTHNFITFFLAIFFINGFMMVSHPFIKLWIGEKFVLSRLVVVLLLVNFFLMSIRQTMWLYNDGFGLAWYQRWKSIIESILNIAFSLVFLIVFNLGLIGILLGTILSSLMTVSWYESYIVYKQVLHEKYVDYIKYFSVQVVIFLITLTLSLFLDIFLPNSGISVLIYRGIISIFISIFFIFLFYRKSAEFKSTISIINTAINTYIKRRKN
ncbi:MAG: oligosaccharide flippase family protein [Streptococcaceae bacterium]|jgi:O-antigen/teichoic acid export membrane protein|nr:oligosaccharide flippase family protein [Streptococcaceae bacterium]